MTSHSMGESVVSVPLFHLGRHGVLSELFSVVRTLGLWLLDLLLSPSDVLQVPEALSLRVVALLAVVVLVFPPSEVAQEVVLVLRLQMC